MTSSYSSSGLRYRSIEMAGERSKEAAAMLALHDALRNVCVNYDWTYSVFWTIRPRPRCRGGSSCKVGEDNGSLMLMWEDGYCHLDQRSVSNNNGNVLLSNMQARGAGDRQQVHNNLVGSCMNSVNNINRMSNCIINGDEGEQLANGEDPVWKAFRKMSIQLYNYGEGLMGKVASDKCHKWVFKESPECEAGISSYWQSSFDAHPPEWLDQFAAGIQTIAVIQAGQGLLQLGSCKVIAEDLHFVLRMRHAFESLDYPSGLFLPAAFAGAGMRSSMHMTNSMHVAGANILSNMYTTAVGFPPPPSPHSWSLCTNQLQSETRLIRSAGLLQLKADSGGANVNTSCENEILSACNLQSPRLTLMSPAAAGVGGSTSQLQLLNHSAPPGSNSLVHVNVVASTPSSSKLYQRRFSQLMPAATKSMMHQSGVHVQLPFLSNSPPASISSLEALLSQRSPLHAGGASHTSLRNNTQ